MASGSKKPSEKPNDEETDNNANAVESPETSPKRKSLYDLSHFDDNELIVREEKRVSISWSRDNSPAPTVTLSTEANGNDEQAIEVRPPPCEEKPKKEDEPAKEQQEMAQPNKPEISQGARKKTSLLPSPIKSSQTAKTSHKIEEEAPKEEPKAPSKALLQKIATREAEPRKKWVLLKKKYIYK